jgi:hypothetical protein
MVKANEFENVAEIGVWKGRLSTRIANHACVRNLYLVDPWSVNHMETMTGTRPQRELDKIHDDLKEQFKDDPRVHILRTVSANAALKVPSDLDLVFIDANHTYEDCLVDINAWLPKIRPGGILAGDDYNKKRFPGVCRVVNECLPERKISGKVWYVSVDKVHNRSN